jgi:hypothetical protein
VLEAVRHCVPHDGFDTIAQRVLIGRGIDTAWNDLYCENVWEAIQALDIDVTEEDLALAYGKQWPAIVGVIVQAAQTTDDQLDELGKYVDATTAQACLEGYSWAYRANGELVVDRALADVRAALGRTVHLHAWIGFEAATLSMLCKGTAATVRLLGTLSLPMNALVHPQQSV